MKSHVEFAVGVYRSVLADATTRWPDLHNAAERDLSRLRRDVEARGMPFLLATLPSLGKKLDSFLASGVITVSEIPQGIKVRDHKPELFRGLWDMIFDGEGRVLDPVDAEAVFFLRQLLRCFQKYAVPCPPSALEETLDEFYRTDDGLPEPWPGTWETENPVWSYRTGHPLFGEERFSLIPGSIPDIPWNDLRAFCMRFVRGELGWMPSWDLQPRHGPGAVSESVGDVRKYNFPNWPERLANVFPFDWYASGLLDCEHDYDIWEHPSRLVAVPKTYSGPRLICCEPIAHQWMQQGIWRWLEERVRQSSMKTAVNFRDQAKSRDLAQSSSHDGKLCTIDLSSASDRISTRLVEFVFQGSNILDALHATRTRYVLQTISAVHPKMHRLRKFSTMGSACTFPVQTIIFTLLTAWACRLHRGECGEKFDLKRAFRGIAVFGDDIIAPNECYETIKLVLHECGLKVNHAKSFHTGKFRESCGMDAFNGVDVTPARVLGLYDGSPSSMATTVESSNNFFHKGCWITADFIVNQLGEAERKKLLTLPVGEDGPLHLDTFSKCEDSARMRWDSDYQRWYRTCLTTTAVVDKHSVQGNAGLTQYFTEAPDPLFPWAAGEVRRVKVRKAFARVYK